MAYRIVETELALQDFKSIVAYITYSLENASAASAFIDEVETCYANLQTMPYMYNWCDSPRLKMLGYRKAVIRNYIMIYKISERDKTVSILRFFHGRQDFGRLLP